MFRIAALCTIYYPLSHADVIVTRWLDPHPHDAAAGFVPQSAIASFYVAQHPPGDPPPDPDFALAPRDRVAVYDQRHDISRLVAQRYGVPLFATVRDALTLGGDTLAVDGVLLIAEHGEYPHNELDQKLYPRKALFDAIVAVFRESGRVVPLFCDKHLSWNMDWAQEMADTIRAMQIPFLGGSSISLAGPATDLNIPNGAAISESLALFYVHPESYGFHSLEFVQSIIERRAGGETGIRAVQALRGDAVWDALDNGAVPRDLFDAALAVAETRPGDMRANCRASSQPPAAFLLDYHDGHRATHVMLDGHVADFALAVRLADDSRIRAARYATPVRDDQFVPHFAVLDREIQRLFLTGTTPVPLERTLLTTLTVATWMHALAQPGHTLPTPQLQIAYGL